MHRIAACALLALGSVGSGPLSASPVQFQGYSFDAAVIQQNGMRYREFSENGRPTLKVRPGEEYSITLRNPLPVRAAVALSIDGLNTVDGKRTSPKNARKWMIEPNSSITISGWQVSKDSSRKFVFTADENSYADWRERKDGKPYGKNIGVIGAAWFWNAEELNRVLHPPQPFENEATISHHDKRHSKSAGAPAPSAPSDSLASKSESRAGTGMGRQQQNSVTEVEFSATAGMFSLRDVLAIYYEFAKDPPVPLPFIGEEDDHGRFAPEMK